MSEEKEPRMINALEDAEALLDNSDLPNTPRILKSIALSLIDIGYGLREVTHLMNAQLQIKLKEIQLMTDPKVMESLVRQGMEMGASAIFGDKHPKTETVVESPISEEEINELLRDEKKP